MSYNFFQNKSCEYFPCHKIENSDNFNCMFCYCPLYKMANCGGNYTVLNNGLKDCSACLIPHKNYDYIIRKLGETMEKIYFAKCKEGAIIPSKRAEDAGYDIYACFDEDYIVLAPHKTVMIPTGIKSAVSSDYYFQIFERGSTGTKGMGQRCGVIDSGYRGEWFIPITNLNDDKAIIIAKENVNIDYDGQYLVYPYTKAICQAILLPVIKASVNEITEEELMQMESLRGETCLGQSGK